VCWAEIVSNSASGVLTSADRVLVEAAARVLSKFRREWLTGSELTFFRGCLTELGWTPASRSRVPAGQDDAPDSEFAKFLN
jgi:hypothetical protein